MRAKTLKSALVVGVSLAAILLASFFSHLSFLQNLELKILDLHFRVRGPVSEMDSSLVLVTIDDQTFNTLPQRWPYPRSYYAKCIRNLAEAGAGLIVFDLEFTEPYLQDPSQDEELTRAALEAGNVIFAGKLVTEFGANRTLNQYVIPPIPVLLARKQFQKDLPWALVNIVEDTDGFLRRYYLYKELNGQRYYSLAGEVLRRIAGLDDSEIRDEGDYFAVGDLRVPKAGPETFFINYAGPARTFPTYSFANILDDFEFDLGEEDTDIFEMHKLWGTFRGKIVFIGASAEELQDTKFTPFFHYRGLRQKMPGVEAHLNALRTLVYGTFLRYTPIWMDLLLVVFLAGLVGFLVLRFKPLKAALMVFFLFLLFFAVSLFTFARYGFIFSYLEPPLVLLFSYLGNTAYLYLTEQREKVRYRKIFAKYVSENVVEKMLETEQYPRFGGERKVLTVLFSDIRQFTNFSEKYSAEEVVHRLSEYLTEMTDVILQHDGTLDKYVGDEIMAVFGAPFYFENHAEKACRAAVAMMKKLHELRKRYEKSDGEYFNIGIGVHTGEMVVGNLGSRQLFDYTVIGDAVNLGARLEGLNKFYGTNIIISEDTLQATGKCAIVRELDVVRVKGKEQPIRIYELLGVDDVDPEVRKWLVEAYQRGLMAYYEQRWYTCLREMSQILNHFPDDGPAKLYIKRCMDYLESPPAPDWRPITTYETK